MASPADFDLSDAPDIFGDTPSLEGIASEERGLALAEQPVEQDVAPFGGFDLSDAPDIFAVEEEPVVAKGDSFGGFDLSDAPDIFGDTQQDGAFQLDDDNPFSDSAPIISPIPGLTSRGGEVINLPETLADEPPSEFAGREGHLSRDEASMLWYQTVQEYNATKDNTDRVKILGRFMRAWDPAEAERMGLRKDGFIEPEGLWRVVDAIDKPRKVLHTLFNTMFDLRKQEAANIITGGELGAPDMESVANALQRNWAEDKGTTEDGERGARSAALWLATMLEPETLEGAKGVLTAEADYDEGADAVADRLVKAGWLAATPFLKTFGDKTDEDIQESIRKSVEAGSAGGHMVLGMASLIFLDPINFLSMPGKLIAGAGDAAMGLLKGGVDLTPAGIEAASRYSKGLEGNARRLMLDDLSKSELVDEESLIGLQSISDRMTRVDDALSSYGTRLIELEGGLGKGLGRGVATRQASAAHIQESIPKLKDLKAKLTDEFDATVDSLRVGDGPPASELRHAAETRAAVIAVADYNDAVNLAWQSRVPLRGDFAVGELGKIRAMAASGAGADLVSMEKAWTRGLALAGREEGVLVAVNFDDAGKVLREHGTVIKSPEVARLYRKALDGELGIAAKTAAERPQYDILESFLKKDRGVEGFNELKAVAKQEILDISKAGTTRTGRFAEAVFDPVVSIGRGKKGREALTAHRASVARKTDLVSGVDPLSFRMAYAVASKFPWMERGRRALAGVASLTKRPAAYATKNDAGVWTTIPRDELIHPSIHYKAQKSERNRIRSRTLMMQKWPEIRAELLTITDDPEVLKLARHFLEKGWGEAPEKLKEELFAAVSLRELSGVLQTISEAPKAAAGRHVKGAKVLSKEDTARAINAIRNAFKGPVYKRGPGGEVAAGEGDLVEELIDAIRTYGDIPAQGDVGAQGASAGLLGLQKERVLMEGGKAGDLARMEKMKSLKERINLFAMAYEAQLSATLSTNTDLAIAKMADELQPQVNQFHEQLAKIERQLRAKTGDEFKPLAGEVDNLLRELEGIGRGAAAGAGKGVQGFESRLLEATEPHHQSHRYGPEGLSEEGTIARRFGDDVEIVFYKDADIANQVGADIHLEMIKTLPSGRGKGAASSALRRVLKDADESGVSISLEPVPKGPVDEEGLVSWYQRHGFETVPGFDEPGETWMVRRPSAPTEGVVSRPVGDLPVKGADEKLITYSDGSPPLLNDDGTITLYHWTSEELADKAREVGYFDTQSSHSSKLVLSNKEYGTRPGATDKLNAGNVVVKVRVDPSKTKQVPIGDAGDQAEIHLGVILAKDRVRVVGDEGSPVGEPWRVSLEDSRLTKEEHRIAVVGAVEAGEFVPAEVLVHYPEAAIGKLGESLNKDLKIIKAAGDELKGAQDALAKSMEGAVPEAGAADLRKAFKGGLERRVEKALKELTRLQTGKNITRMNRLIRKAVRDQRRRDLVVPYGSPIRARLEGQRARLRGEISSIHAQVQDKAIILRTEDAERKKVLLENLLPRELLPEGGPEREKLKKFVEDLKKNLTGEGTGDIAAVLSIPKGRVDKLVKELADPKLAEVVEKKRRKARRLPEGIERETAMRSVEEWFNARLSGIEARSTKELTPLQEAVDAMDAASVAKGMKGKVARKEDLGEISLQELGNELDAFIKAAEDINYDFRGKGDVRRGYEEAINSQVGVLQEAAASFDSRIEALRNASKFDLINGMSVDEVARVERLVKDPDLDPLLIGKPVAIKEMSSDLEKAQGKLQRLKDSGKGDTKTAKAVRGNIDTLSKRIEILKDDKTASDVIQVAGVMKRFFGDWLDEMKKVGVVDRNLDPNEFFARVNVGGYIPHMKSLATQAKVQALRGRGLLPSSKFPGFLSKREMPGVIDDINIRKRDEIAESVLYHQASKGKGAFSSQEAMVASRDMKLEDYVNDLHAKDPSSPSWKEMVEDARIEHGLDDLYDFFETDPMVLMERYNSMASRTVAAATWIEDAIEMFALSRAFKGPNADALADAAGYIRLDKVSHLESVLKAKLPDGLRKFSGLINEQLSKGVPRKEIVEHLKEMGVEGVTDEIVDGFASSDVFVPKQVASYLNWMNSSDAAYANSVFGQNADAVHSWMKAQATIIAMGHIGRNFIGNVVASSQELGLAAIDPVNQIKAARIWGTWGDEALNAPVQIGKYTKTVSEWRTLFKKRGFFDTSLSHDFTLETTGMARQVSSTQRMLKTGGLTAGLALSGAALGSAVGLAPLGAFAGVAGGLLGARKWSGTKSVRGGGVLKRFIGMTAEEAKRAPKEAKVAKLNVMSGAIAGGLVGSTLGLPGALAGAAIGALTMPDYLKLMGEVNSSVEAQARLSMAVGAIDKGMDLDGALVSTNKALRDYSDMTPLEKHVLRRVFFFYTWEAGNMKFQLDWLRKSPRAANMTASFLNGMLKGQFTEDEISSVPEHQRTQVLLRTGTSRMIALSGLPQEPILDLLTRGKRGIPTGLLTRVNPIPLTMFEWLAGGGHSVYYGKDWEQINNVRKLKNAPNGLKQLVGYPEEGEETWVPVYKNGAVVGYKPDFRAKNPTLLYLMTKVPMWRVMQQYMILSADTYNSFALDAGDPSQKATMLERGGAFLFGWKPTTIDFEQNRNYMAWELEQRLLKYVKNRNRGAIRQTMRLNPQFSSPAIPMTPLDDGEDE